MTLLTAIRTLPMKTEVAIRTRFDMLIVIGAFALGLIAGLLTR